MGRVKTALRRAGLPGLASLGLLGSAVWLGLAQAAPLPSVDMYVAEAPPLSMVQEGSRHGIVGDITLKAASLAGYDLHLMSLPWSRAQHTVQMNDNQLIIPLSRTAEREALYTWIAPVLTLDRAFFSLDEPVHSYEQARTTYRRIGVGLGSAQAQELSAHGFAPEQIYLLKIGENPAQMLLLGRIDAWFNGISEARYIWRQVSTRPLRASPVLMTTDVYLACSKNCDAVMIQRFKAAIEVLRNDGTIRRVANAYLDDPSGPQVVR
jgi:polar amino acid transport system substrate-binding protein